MHALPCAIVGIDPHTPFDFEAFFRHGCGGRYHLVADPAQAAILLRAEPAVGAEPAGRCAARPEAPVLRLHPPGLATGCGLELDTPLEATRLLAALEQARARLPSPAAATQRPLPALAVAAHRPAPAREGAPARHAAAGRSLYAASADTRALPRPDRFDPAMHLLGALLHAWHLARRSGQRVEIRWLQARLRICPLERRIHTGLGDGVLRSLALTRFDGEFRLLPDEGRAWPADARPEALEAVLWRLAVWTSRGRLPRGVTPATRVRLAEVPDLQGLLPLPHGAEIAALWSRHACSLESTAQLLGIPAQDVHLFFCAIRALELLRPGVQEAPTGEAALTSCVAAAG